MPAEPSLWRGAEPLLLASTSATRRALLESAGLPVETEAPGVVERDLAQDARLSLRPLSPAAIARYVALAGERATRSVGAYQVEGLGIHLFARIEGDHAT